MSKWTHHLAGQFLVFDGPDGSGKSTQFRRFADWCREADLVVCEVREPGGTEVGEQIRRLLLDPSHGEMSVRCELMLYMASRAQLVEERIRPALERREVVLADRFISSTLAYQGTAGGVDRSEIMAVGEAAIGGCWPDLVVIFDVDPATAASRLRGKGGGAVEQTLFADRMEQKGDEFQRRVRAGYLEQAEAAPDRYLVIDAGGTEEKVFKALCAGIGAWAQKGCQAGSFCDAD